MWGRSPARMHRRQRAPVESANSHPGRVLPAPPRVDWPQSLPGPTGPATVILKFVVEQQRVLERDNWTCQLCGGPATVADHFPLSRRDLVARGMDPNDPIHGRALRVDCHNQQTGLREGSGSKAKRSALNE
jgi:hypothetical protein